MITHSNVPERAALYRICNSRYESVWPWPGYVATVGAMFLGGKFRDA